MNNEYIYTMLLPLDTDPEIFNWLQTEFLYPYFRFERVEQDNLCKYLPSHQVYHIYPDCFYDSLGISFLSLYEFMDKEKCFYQKMSVAYPTCKEMRYDDINLYRSKANSIFQWYQLFEVLIWGFDIKRIGIFSWTDHEAIYQQSITPEYQKECDSGVYGARYKNQLTHYQYDEYDQPLNEIRTIKMSELTMEDLKHIPQHVLVYITKE